MSYPETMQESIKILEGTRGRRRTEKIPLLSLEARAKLIQDYHPQYREGTRRKLSTGANKDCLVPNEIADLFESKSAVDLERVNLDNPDYATDVLVIGGGGGGAVVPNTLAVTCWTSLIITFGLNETVARSSINLISKRVLYSICSAFEIIANLFEPPLAVLFLLSLSLLLVLLLSVLSPFSWLRPDTL